MSTLPGLASKGEKTKPKFQSLDINSLYRVSRGENLEKQQQKSTLVYKHGMQSLGKVPNARRAPANLPSLKSEYSGSDASIPLVPPGGPGWGKQDSTTSTTSTTTTTTTTTATPTTVSTTNGQQVPQVSSHQSAIALPVTTTIPPPTQQPPQQQQQIIQQQPQQQQPQIQQQQPQQQQQKNIQSATPATTDKSWSSVMSGPDPLHPPPLYQSPQFQHEFPSLSVGDGVNGGGGGGNGAGGNGGQTRTDTQYTPGLSLRPQTEGSWIQGGSRTNADGQQRSNSVPLGGPPQLAAQGGLPQQPLPPQFRAVMPTFMYKGSFAAPGNGTPPSNPPLNGRNRPENRPPPRLVDAEDVTPRPIIKEEELIRMDEIDKDLGWTGQDDIDYNEKLAFSDDESTTSRNKKENRTISQQQQQPPQQQQQQKEQEKTENHTNESQSRNWNNTSSSATLSRQRSSDEELWKRRTQHNKDLELTVQRAKQRKEEEEKRFNEATRQGAAKKLMELEEKMKRNREEDGVRTINPSEVPPKPIIPAEIPLPDFQKEKERDRENRSRTPNDNTNNNNNNNNNDKARFDDDNKNLSSNRESSFRQLTQIEGKNFSSSTTTIRNKHTKPSERDRDREMREQNGSSYSRHYQNQVPPRFQKLRNNLNTNMQSQPPSTMHFSQQHQFDSRWMQNQNQSKTRSETPPDHHHQRDLDDDRREYKRQGSDDSHRSSTHRSQTDLTTHKPSDARFTDDNHDYRQQDYDYNRRNEKRDDDKWQKDKDRKLEQLNNERSNNNNSSSNNVGDDWSERRDKYRDDKERYERPQRPDSRDSRTSRESRHSRDSEPREHIGSWAESTFETPYEERRRDHHHYHSHHHQQHHHQQQQHHHHRDDRRQVPGPITKERIEADDMKNEKRNLTQLKRGQLPEKKISDTKKDEKIEEEDVNESTLKLNQDGNDVDGTIKVWADAVPSATNIDSEKLIDDKTNKNPNETNNMMMMKHYENESRRSDKSDSEFKERDDKRGNRNRNYGSNKNWGGTNSDYHRSSWSKKPSSSSGSSNRGLRSGGNSHRSSGDIRTTDSEGSLDEIHSENGSRINKKFDKDDNREMKTTDRLKFDKQDNSNKRENYIPRGEPSRHGRGGGGGGNFRTTRGGLSKRIDGYGPPPSKSPFGHHDDKEKKCDENSIDPSANDKNKINQQSTPSAGVIGSSVRKDSTTTTNQLQKIDDKMKIRKPEIRRGKSKSSSRKDDESNSDNSDDMKSLRKTQNRSNSSTALRGSSSSSNSSQLRRNNPPPPPRLSGDKKSYTSRNDNMMTRQNSGGALRSSQNTINKKDEKNDQQNTLCNAIADISLKDNLDGDANTDIDEKLPLQSDSDGFQEVKSKKTVKEKQKIDEKLLNKPQTIKSDKDINKQERKPIKTNTNNGITNPQLTQQQISNITSSTITTTLQQPSTVLSQVTNKNQFERPRSTNLAPRFAKQRESHRLQKAQQLQHNFNSNVNDINKMNVYNMKDTNNTVTPIGNAWDKTLGSPLRNLDTDNVLGVATDKCLDQTPSQSNSPSNDKIIGKANQLPDKTLLDGTTPPVNTIIFENTNFKSAPGSRNSRNDKPRSKLDDNIDGGSVVTNYTKPIGDLLSKNDKQSTESTTLQLPLTFKEDNANDIKLDFFESELSHLTADDKTTNKLSITSATGRSMHAITTNSNISTADALNFKIQSVKKMWETPSDHSVGQDDNNTSFSTSFVSDPNTLDPNAFTKGNDTPDDNHEVYSPSPNQVASNNTTNVCKVKPTQQVSGAGGQAVLSSTSHQQHSGIMGPSLMGNPLSPPPLQTVIGTGMNIGQPPQQYTTNQHISYQASLGGSNQYGISAIPSPPTVMYNSTQQLQAQTGLYGPFQIDQSGVLGGQGRSQYSQYPNHYSLGQTASSPYSTQSVYLQTAQPHPPPTAQAPPDIYQNMNNYRLSATGPFGQNQQLNNPTTVLISSTSNSLMSASVKPSNQQISAIGTKAGGVGQAYQQQSQQNQVYMAYEPTLQANYLQSAGVMQRAPTGPVQNNVVPTLQPSSSYYSGSTGQTGYFQQPGSSTLQSAQLQQHQAGYGLQGNVFGTHNQSHTNAGLQSFNSHFLSTPMQLAAALNAQQFRSNLPTQYMKGVGTQPIGDQSGRSQQLKSPGSQEVLSSVFNSGSQISSPKLRQNCKQPPPQPSPTAQHKYNLYQGVGNQQSSNMQRYPPPIQRPVNFQPNLGSVQQNSNAANKHRTNNNTNKAPSRQYYQANSLSSQNDKVDDTKLNDNSLNSTSSTNVTTVINKTVIGSSTATNTVNTSSEITKDSINIDEASALKD